jgi:hypothetical protein
LGKARQRLLETRPHRAGDVAAEAREVPVEKVVVAALAVMAHSKDDAPERMKDVFDQIDADKDGFLTAAELQYGMRGMDGGRGGGRGQGGGHGGGGDGDSGSVSATAEVLEIRGKSYQLRQPGRNSKDAENEPAS